MPTVMRYLDFTWPTAAENLAGDEALLDWAEAGPGGETLRFWEPREFFVVLGYANQASQEVDLAACQEDRVPIYRRISGGGTVLQGPGCLNYTLVLTIQENGPLTGITSANQFIMQRHAEALSRVLNRHVAVQGHTDLTLDNRKFSGNSQRRKQRHLVFHGTFLLHFDIEKMERLLSFPTQQPNYRQSRSHHQFLTHLNVPADRVKAALKTAWNADEPLDDFPSGDIKRLVDEKYSREDWNLKFP